MGGVVPAGDPVVAAFRQVLLSIGQPGFVDRLADLARAHVRCDSIAVVRYTRDYKPEILKAESCWDSARGHYHAQLYVHDPYYSMWQKKQLTGVLTSRFWPRRRPPFMLELLSSLIFVDEIAILLPEADTSCIAIFLDRKLNRFSPAEHKRLENQFDLFASLVGFDRSNRSADNNPPPMPFLRGATPRPLAAEGIPDGLWPRLTSREKDYLQLVLLGAPNAIISRTLMVSQETLKTYRQSAYAKLGVTTERQIFQCYVRFLTDDQNMENGFSEQVAHFESIGY